MSKKNKNYEPNWYPGQYVQVAWRNASLHAEWLAAGETVVPAQCLTVGYVVEDSATCLTVAQSLGEGGQRSGFISIPRAAVKRVHAMALIELDEEGVDYVGCEDIDLTDWDDVFNG